MHSHFQNRRRWHRSLRFLRRIERRITLRSTVYSLPTGYPVVTNSSVASVLKHSYAVPLHYTVSQLKVVLGRYLYMDTECVVFKR